MSMKTPKHIAKCIRILFPENTPDRTQRVLKLLRDDNAKDHHVPGSLTWHGRCAVDHAAADIIEQQQEQLRIYASRGNGKPYMTINTFFEGDSVK
ncbi:MAG: hypothetical protein IJ444_02205 [Kiritimatiellae bacterium]|nr:hypothetical protein [Kiritimatiellia bacterium]